MSGDETELRIQILALRALISQEEDVHKVMDLCYAPSLDKWVYLIQTPFATWPKYVVGVTDFNNEVPEVMHRCNFRESAENYFRGFCFEKGGKP